MALFSVIGRMDDDASCNAYRHAYSSATAAMSGVAVPVAGWYVRWPRAADDGERTEWLAAIDGKLLPRKLEAGLLERWWRERVALAPCICMQN
jgi:hypothetical protein